MAEPTERNTPNPGSALKEPSPVIAKLRALAADHERADRDLRADGLELHHDLRAGGAGVEPEVARGESDVAAEADLERVDRQLEGIDLPVREGQRDAERLVVGRAVGPPIVGGEPVGDGRAEGLAREELRTAGGDVDRAGEAGLLGAERRPPRGSAPRGPRRRRGCRRVRGCRRSVIFLSGGRRGERVRGVGRRRRSGGRP